MANTFYPEPIDGSDTGIWGPKELKQNRISKGVLSAKVYDDSGTLKLTTGQIGFDNDSGNGIVIVDTVTTIDISGITNSRWFTVELTRVGTTPSFTAVELGSDTNPYDLPTSLDSYYDPEKGGYYRISTARIVGFGWKATAGTLAGILNVDSIIEGYAGYSTGEVIGHVYRWDKRIDDTYDGDYLGYHYQIPYTSRASAWVLSAGNATSFTDVDCSSYLPVGVKRIRFKYIFRFNGDGALDQGNAYFRANGETETDEFKLERGGFYLSNLGAGLAAGPTGEITSPCDSAGIIEYYVDDADGSLWLSPIGYWI